MLGQKHVKRNWQKQGRGSRAGAATLFHPTPTQIIFVLEFSQKIVDLTGIFQILPKN